MKNNSIELDFYKFPKSIRWLVAHSALIQQVSLNGQRPRYGPKGKLIYAFFLKLKNLKYISLMLIQMIGLLTVTRYWWKAKNNKQQQAVSRVFVGFGAGPEEDMWQAFNAESIKPSCHLDQTRPESFGSLYCPKLVAMWKGVWVSSLVVYRVLQQKDIRLISLFKADFFTFAAMRIGQYVFFRYWWMEMSKKGIEQVVFIAADTPAFACLDVDRISLVEFRQHGLLRKSIIMPQFHVMKLLTEKEKSYYKPLLTESKISVVYSNTYLNRHKKILLLASCYEVADFHKKDYLSVLNNLFQWAEKKGLQIIVRKHPRECDDFWQEFFPNMIIDNENAPFDQAIFRIQPMIMVTWFSTTLVDALRLNVVPVSISSVDNRHVQDLIVKLDECCLVWPKQVSELDSLVSGKVSVDEMTRQLLNSNK